MNTEMLKKVADAIEAEPDKFDIDSWFEIRWSDDPTNPGDARFRSLDYRRSRDPMGLLKELPCGTTCCIAGMAEHIGLNEGLILEKDFSDYGPTHRRNGAWLLGLSEEEAESLFAPGSRFWMLQMARSEGEERTVSPEFCVVTLRKLIDGSLTLTVDREEWDRYLEGRDAEEA